MTPTTKRGLLLALGAYISWGITPLYWKLIQSIPVFEITLHRIVWAFVFLFATLIFKKKSGTLLPLLKNSRTRNLIFLNATLIGSNWFIYVHAINSNHVVEASLGYFINPLFSVLLGIFLLNERPSRLQIFAIAFAFIGVSVMVFHRGAVPWTALVLASTFACYGLIRKKMQADTLAANTGEVLMMLPVALYFFFGPAQLSSHSLGYNNLSQILLILCGAITAIPLLLFAESTKYLRLATVGFLQYISPSLQFILGVFIFREPFGPERWIAFALIWWGLGLYTYDLLTRKAPRKAHNTNPS